MLYIDSSVYGNAMWSDSETQFRSLALTSIHQKILEETGDYKLTQQLLDGVMGKDAGCNASSLGEGCDNTCN